MNEELREYYALTHHLEVIPLGEHPDIEYAFANEPDNTMFILDKEDAIELIKDLNKVIEN